VFENQLLVTMATWSVWGKFRRHRKAYLVSLLSFASIFKDARVIAVRSRHRP